MNTLKYLTSFYSIVLFCLIPILSLNAQDWNFQAGVNAAHFRYQSPVGLDQNFIQPEAGLHLSLLRNNRLVDSTKTTSGFVRKLAYQVGLAINQFNSLGETQHIPFTYSSTFVGLKLGLGMKSNLGRRIYLSYGGLLQINQLILGSQKMGNQVFNLQGNAQFDRIQWQAGTEIRLAKQLNSQMALFTYFSDVWQLNTIQKDGSQFAINPVSFGFGINYSPLH
jgi:hypothetical protein